MDEPDLANVRTIGFFELQLWSAEFKISRLVEFYDEGELHFNIGLDDLKKRWPPLGPEWVGYDDHVNDYVGAYVRERDELADLLVLKRHFAIVSLFTVFEVFLRKTLRHFRRSDRVMLKRIRGIRWDELKKEFAKLGVPITKPDQDWHAIMGMKMVRNCIMHAGGRPDKNMERQLATYKIPRHHSKKMTLEIALSEGYFRESVDLVKRSCSRIARDCQNTEREHQPCR